MISGGFYWLVLFFCVWCCSVAATWKDEWILNFEKNALREGETEKSLFVPCVPDVLLLNCTWRLPRHFPARKLVNNSQLIPKVIFQTWKSYTAAGVNQFNAVMSFIETNPDYEYYLFDDQATLDFMRVFHSERVFIYEQILSGAMRADIWRLAVIQKYGGVYIDIDSHAHTPFSEFIWPNASVVTGIGAMNDFHQWALLYTPNHPIVSNALQYVFHRVKVLYREKLSGSVAQTTGPGAFHSAVKNTLYANKCSINKHARANSTVFVHNLSDHFCSRSVGVLQIYNSDYLGGNVVFKDSKADTEMKANSIHYSIAQKQYNMLFKADNNAITGNNMHSAIANNIHNKEHDKGKVVLKGNVKVLLPRAMKKGY